jgi:hypothetical protein
MVNVLRPAYNRSRGRTTRREKGDGMDSQRDLVRFAESCPTSQDIWPRKPKAKSPEFKPGDIVTRQGTVLSEARGMVWVRWDEGPKSCHLGAYLEAR